MRFRPDRGHATGDRTYEPIAAKEAKGQSVVQVDSNKPNFPETKH
jgi:hypothetical protein